MEIIDPNYTKQSDCPDINLPDVMHRLFLLGEGSHYCGWFKGWVSIRGDSKKCEVMWTTSKEEHNPIFSTAISVEFRNEGIGYVFTSAITMHLVKDEKDRIECAKRVVKKIGNAYSKRFHIINIPNTI